MSTETLRFTPIDNNRLANLCGPIDEYLRQIQHALDVSIVRRNERFTVNGALEQVRVAAELLESLYAVADRPLTIEAVQLALIDRLRGEEESTTDSGPVLLTRRSELRARTPGQSTYLHAIQAHDITFGIGPAGTGKTYLAVASAVDALEREQVKRLVLVRPAVEAGERLGFLPGDLTQKIDPYLRPLYDALYDLLGFDKVQKYFDKNVIEIAPLAFMRGRTLNQAFIILDEAQNTTPEQMKMFLTRIGFGSKAVITGDVTQIDLARHQKSGLIEVQHILQNVSGIAFQHFSNADVVRHPLVQRIVQAYDDYDLKMDTPPHA